MKEQQTKRIARLRPSYLLTLISTMVLLLPVFLFQLTMLLYIHQHGTNGGVATAWTIQSHPTPSAFSSATRHLYFHTRFPFGTTTTTTSNRMKSSSFFSFSSTSSNNENEESMDASKDECSITHLEQCFDPTEKEKVRMEAVRYLQKTFYATSSSSSFLSTTCTDENQQSSITVTTVEPTVRNGGVVQLPLWQVPWTEVPGRTNVLSVHEPLYTNMFEELIRTTKNWYFGHLYNRSYQKNQDATTIVQHPRTWRESIEELDRINNEPQPVVAVLGTLMKITDYRRMEDGKLLLLVQAMERFVVTDIVQIKPFGVANVQLLPDHEELQLPVTTRTMENPTTIRTYYNDQTEQIVQHARALAVVESWQQWHPYEFETTVLPLPVEEDMSPSNVVGSALAKVLPYAPFDTTHLPTAPFRMPTKSDRPTNCSNKNDNIMQEIETLVTTTASKEKVQNQKPLEVCLLDAGILSEVGVPDALLQMPPDVLERKLWLALNNFFTKSRTPVSPVLLSLLPPPQVGIRWPSTFVLERIANTIQQQTGIIEHKYRRVSTLYPALRRQKRLSYCAAHVLEQRFIDDGFQKDILRQQLLEIPSTKLRLAYILWIFDTEYGEFQ